MEFINVEIEGQHYLFNVSNRVLAIDEMTANNADLSVKLSKADLVHLFLVKDMSVKESDAKVVKGDINKLQRLVDVIDTFSPFYLHVR